MTPPPSGLIPPHPDALRARDPDTPAEVLKQLIGAHPDDFLKNPVVPLLPVLDGSFFKSFGYGPHLLSLMKSPHLPAYLLRDLYEVGLLGGYLGNFLVHPRLPPRFLFRIVARWHSDRSAGFLGDSLLSALLLHGASVLGAPGKGKLRQKRDLEALGEHGASVVAGLLPSFSENEAPAFRCYAAAHSCCPEELAEQLSRDAKPSVRAAVATNPAAPLSLRLAMAQSKDASALVAMAQDPESPPEIFEALALSSRVLPRILVAEQPRAPASVLEVLREDASALVRQALSWNVAAREFFL